MIISAPRIEEADGLVRSVARVALADGSARDIWFGVTSRHAGFIRPDNADPFFLGLIQVAMTRGEDMVVEGSLSRRLKLHADTDLQSLLMLLKLDQRPVRITAETLRDDAPAGQGVGTGISGGVDSFTTLLDFGPNKRLGSFGLTHLFFHSVGALEERDLADRLSQAGAVAELAGCELVLVRSNLPDLNTVAFIKSHTLRNLACAALLPGLLRRFYYSSGYCFAEFKAGAAEIAKLEPMLVPLLSTSEIEFMPVGAQYTRVEKTRRIADFVPAQRYLNVCVSPDTRRNCSKCMKCGRTLMTLECLGVAERFADVFDLETWRSVRSAYIGEHLLNWKMRNNSLSREVRELARERGYRYSAWERFLGLIAGFAPKRLYDRIALGGRPELLPPKAE